MFPKRSVIRRWRRFRYLTRFWMCRCVTRPFVVSGIGLVKLATLAEQNISFQSKFLRWLLKIANVSGFVKTTQFTLSYRNKDGTFYEEYKLFDITISLLNTLISTCYSHFYFFLLRPELLIQCRVFLYLYGDGRRNFIPKFYGKVWLLKFVLYPISVWLGVIQLIVLFFRTNGKERNTRTGLCDVYFIMLTLFWKFSCPLESN